MAGFAFAQPGADATGPMVVLFERDDSIAVPLLSHIRMAGYDVRSARTPVELFDLLGKHQVGIVLVDLGSATAGRREFWVALDSKRSGTNVQVLTFRLTETAELQEGDSMAATAVPDVRIHSRNELHMIVEGVRQRLAGGVPLSPQLNSALGALSTMIPMGGGPSQWDPGLSVGMPGGFGEPLNPSASSVFAQPSQVNPFADPSQRGGPPSMVPPNGPPSFAAPPPFAPADSSPFAAPLTGNPFLAPGTPLASNPSSAWQGSDPGRGPSAPSGFGGQSGVFGSGVYGSTSQPGKPSIADAWVPPDGGAGVAQASPPPAPYEAPMPYEAPAPRWDDAIASASMVRRPFEDAPPPPKPAPKLSPDEMALSEVLMDGALISPETLDVLKGVRAMLDAVNMHMNIGELAMLFRFLSPDQLLAAILVSRSLVSPQQIAHLGRKKQELAAEGKDYNLETLIAMSGLLSNEQLAKIRQEIGLTQR
ncbi:MAG TPA: hypothetical protein VF807_06315 [Ktedonobacterales bacterium]